MSFLLLTVLRGYELGSAFAREPYHVLVVVLNPPAHRLAIDQLDADCLLLLSQSFQEAGFFEGLFGRRCPAALGGVGVSLRAERHANIVHGLAFGLAGA